MQLALVIGLTSLMLIAAAVTVAYEDRRALRQQAERRRMWLARLGEFDPR